MPFGTGALYPRGPSELLREDRDDHSMRTSSLLGFVGTLCRFRDARSSARSLPGLDAIDHRRLGLNLECGSVSADTS